ncbi:MAG: 50S ribosomal protein L18 [Alphaproteobacteria bacterium]
MLNNKELFARRARRARYQLRNKANGKARLSVFRSSKHIYAQIIDDLNGNTLCMASSKDKTLRDKLAKGGDVAAATEVGKLLGERAAALKVDVVVFDRGGYKFHGRVKALADAAREAGLKF